MSTHRFGQGLTLVPLTALAALLFAGCAQAQPEGKLYTPGTFDRLDVAGSAQVKLTQGDRDQVLVHGDAVAQKNLQLELTGSRLLIRSTDSWKFWSNARVQVEVQMRKLSEISLSGASDLRAAGPIRVDKLSVSISGAGLVRMDELHAGEIRFDISGAGDGQLAGQAGELSLSVSGKGKLLAEQLKATKARVSISGIGSANLWVTDDLKVSVSGIGDVDYWGSPNVKRSTSGMASITGHGDKR